MNNIQSWVQDSKIKKSIAPRFFLKKEADNICADRFSSVKFSNFINASYKNENHNFTVPRVK